MKYFRPNPSDLREGYECEIRERNKGLGIYAQMMGEKASYRRLYSPVIIGKIYEVPKSNDFTVASLEAICKNLWNSHPSINEAYSLLKEKKLRTRYLCKEQILGEGWKERSERYYQKGNFLMETREDYNVTIRRGSWFPEETIFKGEVTNINTFREMCKVLKIK